MSRRAPPPAATLPRSLGLAFNLTFGLAVGLGLAGCDTYLSGEYFVPMIRDSFERKGNDVRSVTCPKRFKVERRATVFRCEIELASGTSGAILVTLNQEGELSWTEE